VPTARNGSIDIYYEVFGLTDDPLLILVNGLGNQCISYRPGLIDEFVRRGFRVARFDNRDVGLSSDGPDGYTLGDMASDAVAVLDAIGDQKAHFFGASLGGMIVQTVAIEHASRVLSITSVMSTTGDREVGGPTEEARVLLVTPGSTERDKAIDLHIAGQRVWGSPGFVEWDVQREIAGELFDRACRPAGVARQYRAARDDRSRTERLRGVTVPFLVLHGTADTLIDISGGRRTAEVVPGARFVAIEGMGHDWPRHFWPRLADEVARFALQS
jgi:pimeloyl-ACP methyl ester carboxylesterase